MVNKRQTKIPLTIPTCSANFLKLAGTFLLTFYLFGQSIIQNGLLNSYFMTTHPKDQMSDAFVIALDTK